MPVCRDCQGLGYREIKKEIMTTCPDCDGTKRLADGSECERCNPWGEIGTGEFQVERQLCNTCWGSGKVSEGSMTVWFLVRAVPATLLLLGLGGVVIWASWRFWGNVFVTSLISVIFFGTWGGVMYYFISQMPSLGEISVTNWFLIRALPTTATAGGVGGPIVWSSWVYWQNAPITAVLALSAFAIWGALMFYFISRLPE